MKESHGGGTYIIQSPQNAMASGAGSWYLVETTWKRDMVAITEFDTRAEARAALHAVDHSAMDLPVRKYELEAGLDITIEELDAVGTADTDREVVTVDDGRYLGFVTRTLQFQIPDPAQVLCDFEFGGGGDSENPTSIGVFGSTAIATCELWRRTFQRAGPRHATSAAFCIHGAAWVTVGGGFRDLELPTGDSLLYDPDNDNFDSWEAFHMWFVHTVRAMLDTQPMIKGVDVSDPVSGDAWMEVTYDDRADRNMRATVRIAPDRAVSTCKPRGRSSYVYTVPFNRAVSFACGGETEAF